MLLQITADNEKRRDTQTQREHKIHKTGQVRKTRTCENWSTKTEVRKVSSHEINLQFLYTRGYTLSNFRKCAYHLNFMNIVTYFTEAALLHLLTREI